MWYFFLLVGTPAATTRVTTFRDVFAVPLTSLGFIESRIPRGSRNPIETRISLQNDLLLFKPSPRHPYRTGQIVDVFLTRNQWEVSDMVLVRYNTSTIISSETVSAILGVGPGSPLVAMAGGSVSIINTHLVLGPSFEFYASTCVPGSIARVPFLRGNDTMSSVVASIDGHQPSLLHIGSYGSPMLLSLNPGTTADQIEAALRASCAVQVLEPFPTGGAKTIQGMRSRSTFVGFTNNPCFYVR